MIIRLKREFPKKGNDMYNHSKGSRLDIYPEGCRIGEWLFPYSYIYANPDLFEIITGSPNMFKEQQMKTEDKVNPPHYKGYSVEVIEMMVSIWGTEAVALHCEMCAFKYSMRVGMKSEDVAAELGKRDWYLNKAKDLRGA